ncbi:Emp24p [Coccidioides immitis RMSCC 3703]|uniref:Emp24p n=1 Tax=Coccidioides immitis RMSCC 3703 TaxID=454286 RepID=A0A0J8R575_COCIT|nr:Emp24p [Coccidioides immitis RMSCC 3703]
MRFSPSTYLGDHPGIEDPARPPSVHHIIGILRRALLSATRDGRYVYCFGNEAWSSNSKEVSFNVHGIVYVPESELPTDPLETEVKKLSQELAHVKDEQQYIIVRERTHRNTAESTNARVKWWSLFQLGVLISNGIFQVWWLKRFFEVKRVV